MRIRGGALRFGCDYRVYDVVLYDVLMRSKNFAQTAAIGVKFAF